MALQFILGTATADHQAAMLEAVQTVLTTDPAAQVFYLVPNHVKFEAEVALLQGLRAGSADHAATYAQSRVQVYSFTRLAWYYLKNAPVYQQPRLDRAANTMLVAKLLAQHQSELVTYAGEVARPGFIAQLADQLSELQTGRVTAALLSAVVADLPSSAPYRAKFTDLAHLASAYEQAIGPFATNASLLVALQAALTEADLSHTYFFLDDFNDFAASEFQLVETMLTQAAGVTVALTLDKPAPDKLPQAPALFLPAARVYQRLYQAAREAKVPVRPDHFAAARAMSASQAAVAQFFVTNTTLAPPAPLTVTQVTLAKATDAYVELRTVAKTIKQAVHSGAHYRDFLVLARHLDPYRDLVAPVFKEYDIPVFIDVERQMQHHSLVNLIEAVFAVQAHHYRYQDVLRLLRTELVMPKDMTTATFREAVDVTDNHLLRTGLSGNAWLADQPWQYFRRQVQEQDAPDQAPEKTAQLNAIREFVAATLPLLFKALETATTGQAAATALYNWLVTAGVPDRLTAWRQEAIDRGDLAAAQTGEQAWATLMTLLDDYVTILGAEPFDLTQFAQLLEAGFAGATFTQIPSTLDQVVVSETGLARLPRYRHVFVIGATSAVMPDVPSDDRVLTAAERDVLAAALPSNVFLPAQGPATTLGDPFINYVGIMAASESLTMSYPVYAERDNNASPYLTQMAAAFQLPLTTWQGVTLAKPVSQVIGTARSLLSDFVVVAREAASRHEPLGPAWQAVFTALAAEPTWRPLAIKLNASLTYTNEVGQLAPRLATALYGTTLAVSVSRLETYYRDPYEYFLKYGLGLQERPEFELTPADSGSLYHAVMDQFMKDLAAAGTTLVDLAPADIAPRVTALVATLITAPGYEILASSARMQFVTQQITTMLTEMLTTIQQQQARGTFRTRDTELLFGQIGAAHGLAPLILPLANRQGRLVVRGKIDRLDTVELAGTTYYLIIDYKSSARQFKPAEAYYGTALQMLTYLDAVANDAASRQVQATPAGAVYAHFYRPRVAFEPNKNLVDERFKAHKLVGLLVMPNEEDTAKALALALDDQLAHAGASPIVQLGMKQDGDFSSQATNAISQSMLALWRNHNRLRIIQAGAAILGGNIALAPIQFAQEATTITNSPYQAIMTFDPATGYDHYRHVAKLSPEDLVSKLQEELAHGAIHAEPTSGDQPSRS